MGARNDLVMTIGAREYRLVHRRDRGPPARLYFVEPAEKFEGIKARRAANGRARRQRGQNGGDQPVNMEERHDVKRYIRRR